MSYYKRLLGQARSGAPTHREANQDFIRMLEARDSLIRTADHGARYHR